MLLNDAREFLFIKPTIVQLSKAREHDCAQLILVFVVPGDKFKRFIVWDMKSILIH